MHRLIGLLGAKGAGKDTAATLLIERLGFVRTSFADSLYREVAEAFGVTVDFLSRRETKETPLPELALALCKDPQFVEVAAGRRQTKWDWLRIWPFSSYRRFLAKPQSPRWILQLWGTEYRRRSRFGHDLYWLDQVKARIAASPQTRFVITDVRFSNEADFVKEEGGLLGRVRRLSLEALEAQARSSGTATALHPSETELLTREVDFDLINKEGDVNSLAYGLSRVFPELNQAA
jgi:hypothetical protein